MDAVSAWTGELRMTLDVPGELPIVGLAWSPDSRKLGVADHFGNRMVVWDVSNASKTFEFRKKIAFGKSIAFTPDGRFLVVEALKGADAPGTSVNIVDARTGEIVQGLQGPLFNRPNTANAFAVSPDSRYIAVVPGGRPKLLLTYEKAADSAAGTYSIAEEFEWPKGATFALAFAPNGKHVALGGYDGTVLLHEIGSRSSDASFKAQPTHIVALAFSPDGRMLVTGMRSAFSGIGPEADLEQLRAAEKHKIRAYDLSTHTLLGSDDGNLPCVSAFSFHPSGEMLAVACDRTAYLFDRNLKLLRELPAQGPLVMTLAFSPDGRALAMGAADRTVILLPAQPNK